ncbi:RNA 2'-phosphotransferase [Fulvimarina sp. MAC8]|uniref:RNA 2'-phosphotransferase n=1 Tax=Fulvimarina sp. MAC8 TaxID=3162874 RepID=UPI0032ED0026
MSKETSKFLSYILRHAPDTIGLTLGEGGWVGVDELISKARAAGKQLDEETLKQIVATSDKKRFTLSDDGRHIRAAQGHSVTVALGLEPVEPLDVLYHGTATRVLDVILAEGLAPQSRQQVHLSSDEETAVKVGMRHGKPVVLAVDAKRMQADGHRFFRADNGVWLTDAVPPAYLEVLSPRG